MADVQLENGYTKIADDILEALARIRVPGETMQVVLVVLRKTYGYEKKRDWIALSQFCGATGLSRPHVCRAIRRAISMNVIAKEGTPNDVTYSFNKDFDTWKPLPKKAHSANNGNGRCQRRQSSLPKKAHTIDNTTIDNLTINSIPFAEIIGDLNQRRIEAGLPGGFRATTEPTRRAISGRWGEGYRLEDFQHVHAVKVAEWANTESAKYLTPATLYRPGNLEKYRQQTMPGEDPTLEAFKRGEYDRKRS